MSRGTRSGRPSEARTRLLGTATKIFYAEGIHSVGVDRIIEEAQVTRATLYRHFSGKEELVLAYLGEADQGMRAQITGALSPDASPKDDVRAVARAIADGIRSPGFRGCAFLNAVAEYPDPDHPVHRAVLAHREWFLETVTELLGRAGVEPADAAGRHFVMLRDGAMAAGCLFDPELVCETFLNGVESLLTAGAVTSRA
ncbi:TetR/AcrR family transcriptional regulator [Streptomyces cellulosae]|uniref:TetR/AcrR family transcriptional regulator n=1 Tax=unclassified Streptomyces TaxID=2593676 RepID=UPI00109E4DD0|nr:TetR/AcrR family transcriptional regulator [Streptomyces sp. McG7]THC55759.1 TetR/AcrR family transcriptional regulator [Streptomyces sp. Akac8]WSB91329.1 TetR/AcrR family transcriptional regulator [Streptomyces cellulosae]